MLTPGCVFAWPPRIKNLANRMRQARWPLRGKPNERAGSLKQTHIFFSWVRKLHLIALLQLPPAQFFLLFFFSPSSPKTMADSTRNDQLK